MSKLTDEIDEIMDESCDYFYNEKYAKQIAEKCRDTATKAILSLPARNLTRQQAIQVINKAFNDKGE